MIDFLKYEKKKHKQYILKQLQIKFNVLKKL